MFITKLKQALALVMCLALIVAGFPTLASTKMESSSTEPCTMAMDMSDAQDGPCTGCSEDAKKDQQKNGCCDDLTCKSKCANSASATPFLPYEVAHFGIVTASQKFFFGSEFLASLSPPSQDRPPKHLS